MFNLLILIMTFYKVQWAINAQEGLGHVMVVANCEYICCAYMLIESLKTKISLSCVPSIEPGAI